MKNYGLERYVQGLKSLGKVFWISFILMGSTGIASEYVKSPKAKEYLSTLSGISVLVGGASMFKNRYKIADVLNPNLPNWYLEEKHNLSL